MLRKTLLTLSASAMLGAVVRRAKCRAAIRSSSSPHGWSSAHGWSSSWPRWSSSRSRWSPAWPESKVRLIEEQVKVVASP
jgi:hypothetical protein